MRQAYFGLITEGEGGCMKAGDEKICRDLVAFRSRFLRRNVRPMCKRSEGICGRRGATICWQRPMKWCGGSEAT